MNNNNNLVLLVVEDDDGHAELIRMNLERSGVVGQFERFEDGDSLVRFFGKKFDQNSSYLVILDLNMPGMDGYQVIRYIREGENTKNIPIIILTTSTSEKEVSHCYKKGCNFFMTKPFEYERFSEAITGLGFFLKSAKMPKLKND